MNDYETQLIYVDLQRYKTHPQFRQVDKDIVTYYLTYNKSQINDIYLSMVLTLTATRPIQFGLMNIPGRNGQLIDYYKALSL